MASRPSNKAASLRQPRKLYEEVMGRSWWNDVCLSSPEGERGFDPWLLENQAPCWYWDSLQGRVKLYSHLSKGEKPRNTIFWHLRHDDWEAKEDWSRLKPNGRCDDSRCINPWHYEWRLADGPNTISSLRAGLEAGQDLGSRYPDEKLRALEWYVMWLDDASVNVYIPNLDSSKDYPFSMVVGSLSGRVIQNNAIYRGLNMGEYPVAVALLEKLVDDLINGDGEPLSRADAAVMVDDIRGELGLQREEAARRRSERIAQARSAPPAKHRPKPRPGRR